MDYTRVEQPKTIKIKLFPHQLTAIHMMEEREKNHKIIIADGGDYKEYIDSCMSIYADIVGYGKTLSIIGLIVRDKMEWDLKDNYERYIKNTYDIGNRGIIQESKTDVFKFTKINTTLIVVNNSLINQWEKVLDHSELSFFVIKRTNHFVTLKKTQPHLSVKPCQICLILFQTGNKVR